MTLISGDSKELPFDDSSFDIVACRFLKDTPSHRRIAFQEIARVLKPGGRLYLESINGQTLWNFPIDVSERHDIHHSLNSLEEIAKCPDALRSLEDLEQTADNTSLSTLVPPSLRSSELSGTEGSKRTSPNFQIDHSSIPMEPSDIVVAIRVRNCFLAYLPKDDESTDSVLFNVIDENRSSDR